jgi:hypothetical protein
VTGLPAGTTRLPVFDYANLVDGMIYELRTTGGSRPDVQPRPATWSGGRQGLVHRQHAGLAERHLRVRLFVDPLSQQTESLAARPQTPVSVSVRHPGLKNQLSAPAMSCQSAAIVSVCLQQRDPNLWRQRWYYEN